MRHWLLAATVALTTPALAASDADRESRLAGEMALNLFDGEVVELEGADRPFLAAYIEHVDPRGGLVLLHGRGFHPDWQDVVGPLRVSIAEDGWSTLSLQMPVLDTDAKYYDYVEIFDEAHARIEAGIAFLRQRLDGPVVLLAHSCGAHMAMDWIAAKGDGMIDGYIAVGMGATDFGQELVAPYPIDRMRVPFLDILGSDEYPRVLDQAAERAARVEATHALSRQQRVPGADHYFKGHNAELGVEVGAWLRQLAPR